MPILSDQLFFCVWLHWKFIFCVLPRDLLLRFIPLWSSISQSEILLWFKVSSVFGDILYKSQEARQQTYPWVRIFCYVYSCLNDMRNSWSFMGGEGAPAVLRCSEVILYNTMPSTLTFFSLGLVMWCYSISGVWGYQILPCSALGILWASSILDMYVSPLETFFLACPGLSLHLVFLVINGRIDEGGECPSFLVLAWMDTNNHPSWIYIAGTVFEGSHRPSEEALQELEFDI